ncbi:HSP90A molecular chaperone HtpG [Thermotomaculum hydrothermale]|uniref:Chaperone protein HtpG n=1 Tax=Thermotomaculum hydrothermale TaxID=981385 RepID=A0A7R6PMM1_9BACT|nr:molecular chaperone HtpG [Thermotomaculum hydrothermale]BBB31896.1 HSP90A molecular chaperone HtpG [Thermotomaculum hydrothermale]
MARRIKFKSEVGRLLDIVIHSLYKHRDIFLRELISNSVDALNKLKFKQLQGEEIADGELEHRIDIKVDQNEKTIEIIDTGIGMTEDEIIENLGTIAHSGTKKFLELLDKKDNVTEELIGQFGVGFYSVFMVAEKVEVVSKSYLKDAYPVKWISEGKERFTVDTVEGEVKRGTSVKIYLKEDALEFLSESRIEAIVDRYSKFVPYPIYLNGRKLKQVKPLWLENPNSLKKEDYEEFYKYLTKSELKPLSYLHIYSDAPVDLKSIIYIPPFSLVKFGIEDDTGIRLYNRKVLIDEKTEELVPDYLRFLKGVVDSEDIQLNISRETIQNDPVVLRLKKTITSKFIKHLKDFLKKDRANYNLFFDEFGVYLKEGIVKDYPEKQDLAELLLFEYTDGNEKITLSEYLEKTDYKDSIYYIVGEDRKTIEKSPYLEQFYQKGVPVLILTQVLDETVIEHIGKFKEAEFKLITREDITLEKGEKAEKTIEEEDKKFLEKVKEILKDRIFDAVISTRLVKSPYCLVSQKNSPSSQMERMMNALNKFYVPSKKILEFNPSHPVYKNLKRFILNSNDKELKETLLNSIVDAAELSEGFLSDIPSSVERYNQLIERFLELDKK